MKITRYPQSCLKIEDHGSALLVDVGTLATAAYSVAELGPCDAVLFTHTHSDHFDPSKLGELAAGGTPIYGNRNVAQLAGDVAVEVIEDGEEFVVAGFKVRALQMEHCLMSNNQPAGIPNTGYLIDDRLLLPGDSTEDVGAKAEVVAVPIFGPDISLRDAFMLAQATGAKRLLPVHYDVASMNPEIFQRLAGRSLEAEVTILGPGESTDV